jgi:hypothetical protein
MIRTRRFRLITRQFLHIFLTEVLTFIPLKLILVTD